MNNIPKIVIKRNEYGLLENIDYVFNEDNTINWKAMIPKEFLYVNPDFKRRERIEKEYKKPYDKIDPIADNVKDSDLVILLNGLRYILRLRGYNSIQLSPTKSQSDYASVNCHIEFIPNFETEGRPIEYEDNACAHYDNTNSFAKSYLLEMASNRALCRCIRAFLGIAIVSREELGATLDAQSEPSKPSITPQKQITMLEELMKAKNVKWDKIADKLKQENKWDDSFLSVKDLPKDIILNFIERLQKIP